MVTNPHVPNNRTLRKVADQNRRPVREKGVWSDSNPIEQHGDFRGRQAKALKNLLHDC